MTTATQTPPEKCPICGLRNDKLPWVRADDVVPDSERDIVIMLDDGFWQMGSYNVANDQFEQSGGGKLHAAVTHWLDIDPPADAVKP